MFGSKLRSRFKELEQKVAAMRVELTTEQIKSAALQKEVNELKIRAGMQENLLASSTKNITAITELLVNLIHKPKLTEIKE